jgi:maltoporin
MMAEQYIPVCRVIILPVAQLISGGGSFGVENEDLGDDKLCVESVRQSKQKQSYNYQRERMHNLSTYNYAVEARISQIFVAAEASDFGSRTSVQSKAAPIKSRNAIVTNIGA